MCKAHPVLVVLLAWYLNTHGTDTLVVSESAVYGCSECEAEESSGVDRSAH